MNKKNKLLITVLIIFITFTLTSCSNNKPNETEAVTESKSEFLMDTIVDMKVHGANAKKALEASFDRMEEIENQMSKTIKESDVYKINKNAENNWVKVDKGTFKVIKKAVEYAKITEGKFDPSISPLVDAWGIGTENAKVPDENEIVKNKSLVNYENILLDSENNRVKFSKKGMAIDLGGIVKGYAADEVRKVLKSYNIKSAFVNLGGNVLTVGSKEDGSLWKIGIQDPRKNRGSVMAALEMKDKTVVTSGNYERYFEEDGVIYHHILNPETGKPTRNNLLSVSIITDDSFEADVLSTSIFIMGLDKGKELIENRKGIEAIFVTEENHVYLTSGLKDKVEIINSDFEIIEGE
ncbi:MAG: FAD:protein FMN transferase [Bacillota bacterium]